MKRIHILIGLAALVAVSCVREVEPIQPEPAPEKAPVTFQAVLGAASKTIIGEHNAVSWAKGDKLTVFDAAGTSEEFTVPEDCEKFSFTSDGTLGDGPYYAVSGYGATVPVFDTVSGKITVTAADNATEGSFGEADLIASSTEDGSFTFHHVFALLKMSVSDKNVNALTFQAKGVAPGSTQIGFQEDGTLDITYGNGGDAVTVENISEAGTFYVPVNPGTYSDGFTIFLTYTDKKMKIQGGAFIARLGRMVNFGALDSGTPASTVWSLVTDASTLAVGDEIVIVASDYDYALGATQNSNNRKAVSIAKSDDKSTVTPNDEVQILTLTKGSTNGTFGLYTGSGYLYAASSSNNLLKTQTTLNANGSWSITVTTKGVATIKANGTNSRNTIYYNNSQASNLLFSAYASNNPQKSVSIYKKVSTAASGPQMQEVSAFLDESDWGVYRYDGASDVVTPLYQYEIRNGAVSVGSDQYAVGSGSFRIQSLSEGLLAGTVFKTADFSVGKTYPATVTLFGIDGHANGTASMRLIAKKIEDDKVWLQEENGSTGFIISTK